MTKNIYPSITVTLIARPYINLMGDAMKKSYENLIFDPLLVPTTVVILLLLNILPGIGGVNYSIQEHFESGIEYKTIIFNTSGYDNNVEMKVGGNHSLKHLNVQITGAPFIRTKPINVYDLEDHEGELDSNLRIINDGSNKRLALKPGRLHYQYDDMSAGTDVNITRDDDLTLEKTDSLFKTPNTRVDDSPIGKSSGWPALKVDKGGDIHVTYHDARDDPANLRFKVYYTRSSDDGLTFQPGVRVDSTQVDAFASFPDIDIHEDLEGNERIYLTWYDNRTGNHTVYCGFSDDRGATFSETRVWQNHTIGELDNPSIAAAPNGSVHITWTASPPGEGWHTYHAMSIDSANSFRPAVRVDNSTNAEQRWSNIAVDNSNRTYITWADSRGPRMEIYCARSDDGVSFNSAAKVNDASFYPLFRPAVAIDTSNRVHVTWMDTREGGNFRTGYAMSDNFGASFHDNRKVADLNAGYQGTPSIVTDHDDRVHIVFEDGRNGNLDIYYTNSSNYVQFTDNIRVDDTGNLAISQGYADVSLGPDGRLHTVWMDERKSVFGIYYSNTQYYKNRGEYSSPTLDPGRDLADNITAYLNYSSYIPDGTAINVSWALSHDSLHWSYYYNVSDNFSFVPGIDPGYSVRYIRIFLDMDGNSMTTPIFRGITLEGMTYPDEGIYLSKSLHNSPYSLNNITLNYVNMCHKSARPFFSVYDGEYPQEITSNAKYEFQNNENDFYWELHLGSSGNVTPEISGIAFIINMSSFPRNVTIDLYDDGDMDWFHEGQLKGPFIASFSLDDVIGMEGIRFNISTDTPGTINLIDPLLRYNSPPFIISNYPLSKNLKGSDKESLHFSINATDAEDPFPSVNWYVDDVWRASGDNFIYDMMKEDLGIHKVMSVVGDGEFQVNRTWDVEVLHENRPPFIYNRDPDEDDFLRTIKGHISPEYTFTAEALDPDGDILTYRWFLNDSLIDINTSSVVIFFTEFQRGNHTLVCNVTDGFLWDSAAWNLSIQFAPDLSDPNETASDDDGPNNNNNNNNNTDPVKSKDSREEESSISSPVIWIVIVLIILLLTLGLFLGLFMMLRRKKTEGNEKMDGCPEDSDSVDEDHCKRDPLKTGPASAQDREIPEEQQDISNSQMIENNIDLPTHQNIEIEENNVVEIRDMNLDQSGVGTASGLVDKKLPSHQISPPPPAL